MNAARGRLAGEVGAGEWASHRGHQLYSRRAAARPSRPRLRSCLRHRPRSPHSSGSRSRRSRSPAPPRGRSAAAARRRADRARPAQARRRRQRALRRRPPRRREHRAARLPGQRRARAHRLPLAHARRRRPEPDRLRAGAGARPHPHPGAAGRAPHRRRRAVLHPRARLRLLEEPRRDAAHLGQGRGAGRRRRGHPPLPPRRDRHPLLARAGRHARPPHRLGDAGASRRSAPPPIPSFTPSSSPAASTPWQARRIFWNRSSWNIKPGDDLSRRRQARRRRLQPAPRRVVRRDGGRQPQHAQEPGLRRGAIARARPSSTSSCSRRRRPTERARQGRAPGCSTGSTSAGGASPGGATVGALVASARSRSSTRRRRTRRSRRWPRSTRRWTRVPDAGLAARRSSARCAI